MTTARLMLAGGNGRLIRRPSVVLFDPTGMNADLATRFDAADTDTDAVAELKKHLIDSGFNAGPLVVAQWGRGDFDLLVFGDVEVHTSAIAAPMVSGAGSATWIERHLGATELGSTTTVELWSGEAADPSTNLGLGIVACAGFRMSLDFADLPSEQAQIEASTLEVPAVVSTKPSTLEVESVDAAPDPSSAAAVDEATEWVPTEDPATEAPAAPVAASAEAAGSVFDRPVSPASPSGAGLSSAVPVAPGPASAEAVGSVFDSPVSPAGAGSSSAVPVSSGAASAEAAGSVFDPPGGAPQPAGAEVPDLALDPPTVPPPAQAAVGADPFTSSAERASAAPPAPSPAPAPLPESDGQDPFGAAVAVAASSSQTGLVESALCQQGHPNPPRSAACHVCGQHLVDDQSLSLIEQPTVGRILFIGGQGLSLSRPVAMGRKPDHDGGRAHPVVIDHVEVSRSHAAITIQGWTVLLTDQGSRNGTWVTPANDPTPVRLEANVPHVLEHGTTVHLGGPEVSFTYLFDEGAG